ncbi:transglutaminase domain-containing protein [Helicobacter sp. 11S02596-1]|uniref:transglutaminase-like domain-containing protein n=1 Tax=Helicobacter sp. 11S02596-1 TaxID=1476194 RepID=UPI000BC461E2|nr:transglutaminase domain-containing protein [Helicobacter sp. 11S02596-1]PAF41941.1 hypothetical protein BJI48_07745 [Helicobacter sp. 11S02596-1]
MERRDFIKTSILGTGVLMGSSLLGASVPTSKKISLNFSYQINFDSAKEVKLWIPMPLTSSFQQPSHIRINGNYNSYKTITQNATPIVFAQYNQAKKSKNISIALDVLLTPRNAPTPSTPQEDLKDFIKPTRYIRTDGLIAEIASKLKANDHQKTAQNIYAWITNNLDYENAKNTRGIRKIQTKDAKVILSGKNISATTLFVSLSRACGIPAREAFGLELSGQNVSFVSKAEVYSAQGWIPYDVITPIKNPSQNGSNKWLGDFVLLNYERDMRLENFVLSSFDSPFGLVDNDRLNYYAPKHFRQTIGYRLI